VWGLVGETTSTLLDVLVDQKFLRRTSDEGYVRLK
jgi:DNA-binding IclR family transcriptional regulator